MVMKFDPYDTLMINCGNRILIVFHLYCCSKHELSTMLIVIMFRNSKNYVHLNFCAFYLYYK